MYVVQKLKQRAEDEVTLLRNNQMDVEDGNRKMFRVVLHLSMGCFALLLLLSFVLPGCEKLQVPYAVIVLFFCLQLYISYRWLQKVGSLQQLYTTFFVLCAYATYLSGYVCSGETCLMILALLFVMPVVALDKGWRVLLFEGLAAVFYLAVTCPRKLPQVAIDEAVNVLVFSVLASALGNYLRRMKLENFELKRQAVLRETTDPMTGLFSRRKLFDTLNESEAGGQRICAIIMVDVDDFKLYNDTYGHQAGDQCLNSVGACLQNICRSYPVAFYRYGGEEFLGAAFKGDAVLFRKLCRELNYSVRKMRMPHKNTSFGYVTVSIGLATNGAQPAHYERLLLQADAALYAAKNRGKNQTVEYTDALLKKQKSQAPESSFHLQEHNLDTGGTFRA